MLDEVLFSDEANIHVTVASVGISRKRWISAGKEDVESGLFKKKMERGRFDVLPIDTDKEKVVKEYFKTETPNQFDSIGRYQITFEDTIPVEMGIQSAIDRFSEQNRTFYFLPTIRKCVG